MKRLHELEVGEVSLVPEGANKRKFLIFKSKEGQMPQPQEALQKLISGTSPEVMKNVESVLDQHMARPAPQGEDSAGAIKRPAAEQDELVNKEEMKPEEMDQARHAIKAIVRIISPWKDKLSPELLHEVLDAAGFESGAAGEESHEELGDTEEFVGKDEGAMNLGDGKPTHDEDSSRKDPAVAAVGKDNMKAIPEKVLSEEDDVLKGMGIKKEDMEEAKKSAMAAYKEHMSKLGHRMYPDAEIQMKSVQKDHKGGHVSKTAVTKANGDLDLSGLPETARRAFESIHKSQMEAVAKAAELEAKLKERDAKEQKREIVQKAAAFTHLGLKMDDVVATLEDAQKVSPESYERVLKGYETLNEQAKKSKLFAEFGSSQGHGGASDAEAKINAAVDQVVQKSGGTVTKEQAYENFIRTPAGQSLYAEFKSARKDGI